MVFKKRCAGSRGRQFRAAPRVPTLAPGKRSTRRNKNEMYGLDLLATVAGSLSADEEDSSSGPDINGTIASYATIRRSVKSEQFDDVRAFNTVALRKDCCEGCTEGCANACAFRRQNNTSLAENSSTQNVADIVLESHTEKPDAFIKGSSVPEYGTTRGCHSWSTRSAGVKQVHQAGPSMIRSQVDGSTATLHSSVDTVDLDASPPSVVSSDGSSGVHLGGHDRSHNSSPFCQAEVQQAVDRDDDENSSGCVHPSTPGMGGYLSHYIGECRTRKLPARFRNATRNEICGEMFNKGSELNLCGNKISTIRRRAQLQRRMFRTRRLTDCYSAQPSDEGVLSEISQYWMAPIPVLVYVSIPVLVKFLKKNVGSASGTPFCMDDQDPPCASEGYHVKLAVKSFKFPELVMEIPENATVGLLKKIVMDAVTSTIEGNLCVGVLLQGNAIQDDNKTLHQAGIRHGAKLNNIEFTLECEAERDSHPSVTAPEEADSVGASVVEPLSMIKCEEPLPENVDELTIVPIFESNRSGMGQRRKRTPFSVAEVEALVGAVEQFGTSRWRDVRLCAFGNSGHRTKVDLKDKWKNIMKTANLPPELRRGSAIPPQELLDRVLAAQAYWSLQQAQARES